MEYKMYTMGKVKNKCWKSPGQGHQQRDQVHVLDVQAALQVPRRTSQLCENVGQNLYPGPCENELVQTDFLIQSTSRVNISAEVQQPLKSYVD